MRHHTARKTRSRPARYGVGRAGLPPPGHLQFAQRTSPGRVAGEALRVGTWTRVAETPAPAAPTKIPMTRMGSIMDLRRLSEMCNDAASGVVLLNDLIRAHQQRRRDREAKGLGGLEVDDQLNF